MTRLLRAVRSIDLTDIALIGGLVLLGYGLAQVSGSLAAIVVGGLLLVYGALPLLATLRRQP
jgi:hypothetical protein